MAARRDPRIQHHPMVTRANWMKNAIAITLHTDAVPVLGVGGHHTNSLDVFSWQSLFTADGLTVQEIKNYIFSILEDSKTKPTDHGGNTQEEIWRIIAWSFLGNAYRMEDASAECALAGSFLADGFFGVVWGLKADLEA